MLKALRVLGTTIVISLLLITSVACQTEYRLSVTVGGGQGEVTPSSGKYAEGTSVTLTAIPDSGWEFDRWEGDVSGDENPAIIRMNRDKTIEVYFTQVNIEFNPEGISKILWMFDTPKDDWVNTCSMGTGGHVGDDYYADDWARSGADGQTGEQRTFGQTVYAGISGTAIVNSSHGDYGQDVVIYNSQSKFALRNAHLSEILVSDGQFVNAGDSIGKVGSTGNSDASHLHIALYKNVDTEELNGRPIKWIHWEGGPTEYAAAFTYIPRGSTEPIATPTSTPTSNPTLTPTSTPTPTPTPEATSTSTSMPGPTLISPADGTTAAGTIVQGTSIASVSLIWGDISQTQWYEYEVAYDENFGSIATTGTVEGTQVDKGLFLGEEYYWRVRVYNPTISQWSEVWSFTTPLGPASAKPLCMFPTEGLTGVSLTPALQWSSAVEATGFELIVAANCDWSNAIVNLTGDSALPAGTTAYPITQALQQGTNYCWKVRAINANTATNSPWSDTAAFTTY